MRMKNAQHPAVGIPMQAEETKRVVQAAVEQCLQIRRYRVRRCRIHGLRHSRQAGAVCMIILRQEWHRASKSPIIRKPCPKPSMFSGSALSGAGTSKHWAGG